MAIKAKRKVSVSKNVEKLEPLCIASRNENGEATVKNSLMVSQKVKDGITMWSSNSVPEVYFQKNLEEVFKQKLKHKCSYQHHSQ